MATIKIQGTFACSVNTACLKYSSSVISMYLFVKWCDHITKATTYLDFDRERDLDSDRLEALDGLGEPDLLSDLTRAGLP